VMAAIAMKSGGKYSLSEEDINAASGVEFKITKDEEAREIVLRAGDAVNEEPPQIDQSYVPDKLCPFILDDATPFQSEPPSPKIEATDL